MTSAAMPARLVGGVKKAPWSHYLERWNERALILSYENIVFLFLGFFLSIIATIIAPSLQAKTQALFQWGLDHWAQRSRKSAAKRMNKLQFELEDFIKLQRNPALHNVALHYLQSKMTHAIVICSMLLLTSIILTLAVGFMLTTETLASDDYLSYRYTIYFMIFVLLGASLFSAFDWIKASIKVLDLASPEFYTENLEKRIQILRHKIGAETHQKG